MRMMQLRGVAVADLDIGAGHVLQHEAEILRAHAGRLDAIDIGLADQRGGGVGDDVGLRRGR